MESALASQELTSGTLTTTGHDKPPCHSILQSADAQVSYGMPQPCPLFATRCSALFPEWLAAGIMPGGSARHR
jgi:hypothetical protein